MRGANPLRKLERDADGLTLHVQGDPFLTIQGEGPHAGLPATFIRLWGCHLKCHFCDTDFESDPRTRTPDWLVRECRGTSLVVLTGGEPLRQNIAPLVGALICAGHTVQVETAGSFWWAVLAQYPSSRLQFVVSPKTPRVHDEIAERACAWKYIISERGEVMADGLPKADFQGTGTPHILARPPSFFDRSRIYLQPMDEDDPVQNALNMRHCVDLAKTFGYRVSLQQHKLLGVP